MGILERLWQDRRDLMTRRLCLSASSLLGIIWTFPSRPLPAEWTEWTMGDVGALVIGLEIGLMIEGEGLVETERGKMEGLAEIGRGVGKEERVEDSEVLEREVGREMLPGDLDEAEKEVGRGREEEVELFVSSVHQLC